MIEASRRDGFEDLEPLTEKQIKELARRLEEALRIAATTAVTVFFLAFLPAPSNAAMIAEADGVQAVMGEARGEPYLGKVAIAEALRNRGTLNGVYGFKARFQEPERVWGDARRAWREGEQSNLTHGATVWGNRSDVEKFRLERWFLAYEQTAKIGGHYFFRRKGARSR